MTPTITGRVGRKGTALAALAAGAWTLALGSAALATTPTGLTIPTWTTNFTDANGITYSATLVGSDPLSGTAANTTVNYVPIIVKAHFRLVDGKTWVLLDPTATSACDTKSAYYRIANSPLFVATTITSNGVNVTNHGQQQLTSAFQRANFWGEVKSTNYGVTFAAAQTPITLNYSDASASVNGMLTCSGGNDDWVAYTDEIKFDAWLQAQIKALVQSNRITSSTVPIVLLSNTAFQYTDSSGVFHGRFGGYHSTVQTAAGTIAYAVGSYEDRPVSQSGGLTGHGVRPDISHIAERLADLVNDPLGTNQTPGFLAAPSHTATGWICQSSLEVALPGAVNGTQSSIVGVGGFTYHYPDLAFHDFFYRTAATGAGGKYSFLGQTSDGGAVCTPSARIH